VLLSAHHYPSDKTSLFAAHGTPLMVPFALFLPLFGKEKTIAEPTLKAEDIGRTALCDLARTLEVSVTVSVRGLCLCLNDSWLVEPVRGSRIRAAPERRDDFAEADRELRKRLAEYCCLPAWVAKHHTPPISTARRNEFVCPIRTRTSERLLSQHSARTRTPFAMF